MKKITLLLILLSSVFFCNAQTVSPQTTLKDTITLNGNMWKGIKYTYQGNNNVDIRRIKKMLNIDKQNLLLIKQAHNAKLLSMVAAVSGGICLGFGLNSYLANGDFNVPLMATGGMLVGVSLPLSSISIKKMKQAVSRFNKK